MTPAIHTQRLNSAPHRRAKESDDQPPDRAPVWSLAVASGVTCVVLSLLTRQPIVVAWSVPGAALLLTALGNYEYSDAIGAYVVAALLALIIGVTGWFGRLLAIVPKPVMAAVLAGVLLPFVLKAVEAVVTSPIVAGGLVVAFLIGRRITPRYAVLVAMVVGAVLSAVTGQAHAPALTLDLSGPVWTTPTFDLQAIMGIAVPLVIVTMAGQNGPGLAVMGALGYKVNDKLVLGSDHPRGHRFRGGPGRHRLALLGAAGRKRRLPHPAPLPREGLSRPGGKHQEDDGGGLPPSSSSPSWWEAAKWNVGR